MSSFIHSFSHPTNMSAYHMPLFYIQGIQQRAKDSTLKNVCDNNKVVSHSKELKQQDVMEIILLIRKEVSECHNGGQAPRQNGAHNSKIGVTEFPAGRQTSAKP